MRTQKEIVDKIIKERSNDFFGVITNDLIIYLDFENAKQFLVKEETEQSWNNYRQELTSEHVKKEMLNYLEFAFEKANGHRGISAGRSMDHYFAWIWLLDEEDYFGNVRDYDYYGIKNLNKIKEFLID